MSTNLPVPSKAALTALRGIVLGTSCTLALVAEDRRRRINNAVDVLETSKRLKSSRSYHAGTSKQIALAFEDEEIDLSPFAYEPIARLLASSQRRPTERRQTAASTAAHLDKVASRHVATLQEAASPVTELPSQPRPSVFIPPISQPVSLLHSATPSVATVLTLPEEILQRVRQIDGPDAQMLKDVYDHVFATLNADAARGYQERVWQQVTALLCRKLQQANSLDDAAKLLLRVAYLRGTMDASDYFEHSPLELITALTKDICPTESARLTGIQRRAMKPTIDLATQIYLVPLRDKNLQVRDEVAMVGKELLQACLDANRLKDVEEVFRRSMRNGGDNNWALVQWYIEYLCKTSNHALAIRCFLEVYSTLEPPLASIRQVARHVVGILVPGHGETIFEIHQALVGLHMRQNFGLQTNTTVVLLRLDWEHHQTFETTMDRYSTLKRAGLEQVVNSLPRTYRILAEIALKAGENEVADEYYQLMVDLDPEYARTPRARSQFAITKAMQGDWEGVRKEFESISIGDISHADKHRLDHGMSFVAVAKVYAQHHTSEETISFVRSYMEELQIPVTQYLMSFMITHYGSLKDKDALPGWIQYCMERGCRVEGSIANALLAHCKKVRGYNFKQLTEVFQMLKAINPECINDKTEKFMAECAISAGGGDAVRRRLVSLDINPLRLAHQGKSMSWREVYMAMREAVACKRFSGAVQIYQRAVHGGLRIDGKALGLAVYASVLAGSDRHDTAFRLMTEAQRAGHDVNEAVAQFVAGQFKVLGGKSRGAGDIDRTLKTMLVELQQEGLELGERALHSVAAIALRAGRYNEAITLAKQAAEVGNRPSVCSTMASWKLLLEAYARASDFRAFREVVAMGLANDFQEEGNMRRHLKWTRCIIKDQLYKAREESLRTEIQEAVADVASAIQALRTSQAQRTEKQQRNQDNVMRIIQQAAADTEASRTLDTTSVGPKPVPDPHVLAEIPTASGSSSAVHGRVEDVNSSAKPETTSPARKSVLHRIGIREPTSFPRSPLGRHEPSQPALKMKEMTELGKASF